MYLYFNNEGELTTNIPHGEILRQGSFLNIVVCLDLDFFHSKEENQEDWKVNIQLGLPNGIIGTTKIVSDFKIATFRKTNDSEATYDLIDGKEYYMYKFSFTPEQATTVAGKLEIYTSLVKMIAILDGNGVSTGEYSEENIVYNGTTISYIERVFGYDKRNIVDESNLHYNNLVAQINEIDIRKENRVTYTLISFGTVIEHALVNKTEFSFVLPTIETITIIVPVGVVMGFESKINIKNGYEIVPHFINNSSYDIIYVKNGQKFDAFNYTMPTNYNVSFNFKCDGINLYCYIEEIER